MAMVGESELSMYTMSQGPLMDWASSEHGGPSSIRRLGHAEDHGSSYLPVMDHYSQHPYSNFQNPFDIPDTYHTPKVEPISNPSEFDYYNSGPQVISSPGSYHLSGGNSFMSQQPVSNHYGSQSSIQQQGGSGVLEEIDGLLRNLSDVPQQQQQHQDLDVDPILFSGLVSHQQQSSQHSMYSSHGSTLGPYSSVPVMGGQPSPQQLRHWVDANMLVRELQDQFMSDNSSLDSENPPIFGSAQEAAMSSNYYADVGRGHPGVPSNWSLTVATPATSPQQQHSSTRMSSSGLGGGGGYPHADPNYFLRSSTGFGPGSLSSMSLQQMQTSRMSSNAHVNPLADQVLMGVIAPATGLQLVHLLLNCAEKVADNKLEKAEEILAQLRIHVLPDGNAMQRLAAYFEQALTARLSKDHSSAIFKGLTGEVSLPQAEVLEAFSVFYDCIPIGKFGHLTCNQILLDAVEREKVIHVLDLHVWHGMQWPAFLQALALRPGGPPKLRMSAVGSDIVDLRETGEKLRECAKSLAVPFEYCPILVPLESFNAHMVERRAGETLVINSFVQFHAILNKGPNSLNDLLRDLRQLNPRVMAFAENDGNHNNSSFLIRFVECLRYYSAVFDAFDASLPPDSPSRMKMEQIFAAQKIRNIIACEGPARVDGHETMKYWHKRMEAAHFGCLPLSTRAVSQANLLLNLYYSNGYTLNPSDCGYLALGWHGMPLMGVSAWH